MSGLIRTYKDTGSLCALNETREAPCKGILRDRLLVNRSKGATVCYPLKERKKRKRRTKEKTGKMSRFLSKKKNKLLDKTRNGFVRVKTVEFLMNN